VIISRYPRPATLSRRALPRSCRGDENPVTATPLDSAVTNCDARNSFRTLRLRAVSARRIRSCENCRVAYPSSSNFVSPLTFPHKKRICKSLVFNSLRTLPSFGSRNFFVCHSYKKCRVGTNNSHFGSHRVQTKGTRHSPLCSNPFFSYSSTLFCTHQELNSFIFKQIRTLSQKHPGWGIPSLTEDRNKAQCHQDEPDRRLATPSLSPATALPRPCRGHQSLVTPPSCRPLFRMIRFGVP